jgi:hypothetical protein
MHTIHYYECWWKHGAAQRVGWGWSGAICPRPPLRKGPWPVGYCFSFVRGSSEIPLPQVPWILWAALHNTRVSLQDTGSSLRFHISKIHRDKTQNASKDFCCFVWYKCLTEIIVSEKKYSIVCSRVNFPVQPNCLWLKFLEHNGTLCCQRLKKRIFKTNTRLQMKQIVTFILKPEKNWKEKDTVLKIHNEGVLNEHGGTHMVQEIFNWWVSENSFVFLWIYIFRCETYLFIVNINF